MNTLARNYYLELLSIDNWQQQDKLAAALDDNYTLPSCEVLVFINQTQLSQSAKDFFVEFSKVVNKKLNFYLLTGNEETNLLLNAISNSSKKINIFLSPPKKLVLPFNLNTQNACYFDKSQAYCFFDFNKAITLEMKKMLFLAMANIEDFFR